VSATAKFYVAFFAALVVIVAVSVAIGYRMGYTHAERAGFAQHAHGPHAERTATP
jgi:hypothetical protein